jgi:hypothetical protein
MRIDYVPMLEVLRELYRMPRGMERFGKYLGVMANARRDEIDLPPLLIVNPMARDHLPALVDQYLELGADAIAAQAAGEAAEELHDVPGEFRGATVIADDLKGGWTNRCASEFAVRAAVDPNGRRFWITAVLWSSEHASAAAVRETMLAAAHRTAYVLRAGPPRTLRDVLAQEGSVMARAGCTAPVLDPDDLDYTRHVVAPFLESADSREWMECLFGDELARTLGLTPRGLSVRAGLALALADARQGVTT